MNFIPSKTVFANIWIGSHFRAKCRLPAHTQNLYKIKCERFRTFLDALHRFCTREVIMLKPISKEGLLLSELVIIIPTLSISLCVDYEFMYYDFFLR